MRIVDVIGKVSLSRVHPALRGAKWVIGVPLAKPALEGKRTGRGEAFVIYDELGANAGTRIAVSEGAEAAAPFHPDSKPIDAYNAAILDTVDVPATRQRTRKS